MEALPHTGKLVSMEEYRLRKLSTSSPAQKGPEVSKQSVKHFEWHLDFLNGAVSMAIIFIKNCY